MGSPTSVMTGFSPAGWVEYGRQFSETFDRYWPETTRLLAFVEESTPVARGGQRSLWACPGVREFIERHRDDPRKTGHEPVPGWRPKHRDKGYCYRFDAVKFCRQAFIPETAANSVYDGAILAWLDGDVVTYKDVPNDMIEGMLGPFDLIYLGRKGFHAELGFWAVRMGPLVRQFLADWAELWRSDQVFDLSEWHSAFTFEWMLLRYSDQLRIKNLTPDGRSHVWFQCEPLSRVCDHLKGEQRKKAGRSAERVR